jgi:hypothetical protein
MDGMKKSMKKKVTKGTHKGAAEHPTKKDFGAYTDFGKEFGEKHSATKKKGKK